MARWPALKNSIQQSWLASTRSSTLFQHGRFPVFVSSTIDPAIPQSTASKDRNKLSNALTMSARCSFRMLHLPILTGRARLVMIESNVCE